MNRVIVHLSDLHFGRVDEATLDPLLHAIDQIRPDLIAVSGDLTQRARRSEFEQARAFLQRLPQPRIVVPGNHDVHLHNPWLRFVSKWSRFNEYIASESQQVFVDEAISAIGINTGRALTWKGGRINAAQMEEVRQSFCAAPPGALKILVAHHPLDIPSGWNAGNQAKRAERAFARWEHCGVDLILAGHIHRAFAGAASLRLGNHRALIVQAGTATSTRVRGEANSFNVIHSDTSQITVARHTWSPDRQTFSVSAEDKFDRRSAVERS